MILLGFSWRSEGSEAGDGAVASTPDEQVLSAVTAAPDSPEEVRHSLLRDASLRSWPWAPASFHLVPPKWPCVMIVCNVVAIFFFRDRQGHHQCPVSRAGQGQPPILRRFGIGAVLGHHLASDHIFGIRRDLQGPLLAACSETRRPPFNGSREPFNGAPALQRQPSSRASALRP